MEQKNLLIVLILGVLVVSGCVNYSKGIKIVSEDKSLVESDFGEIWEVLRLKSEMAGFDDAKFYVREDDTGFYIEAFDISKEDLENLLAQSSIFKAVIAKPVYITDGKGFLKLGEKQWEIENDTINIDGEYHDTDEFMIEDVAFVKKEEFSGKIVFYADYLTSEDVKKVFTDPQQSGIIPVENGYRFYFSVEITEEAAKRFADLMSGIGKMADGLNPDYLDSELMIFLNNEIVSISAINSDMAVNINTMFQMTGTKKTTREASNAKFELQTSMMQIGKDFELKIDVN